MLRASSSFSFSRLVMSEAMPSGDDLSEEAIKQEIAFLNDGTCASNLFKDPMNASDAAAKIKSFTEEWPDPFAPTYNYSNPWGNKKDNKGKKDRPASVKLRPGYGGDVTL